MQDFARAGRDSLGPEPRPRPGRQAQRGQAAEAEDVAPHDPVAAPEPIAGCRHASPLPISGSSGIPGSSTGPRRCLPGSPPARRDPRRRRAARARRTAPGPSAAGRGRGGRTPRRSTTRSRPSAAQACQASRRVVELAVDQRAVEPVQRRGQAAPGDAGAVARAVARAAAQDVERLGGDASGRPGRRPGCPRAGRRSDPTRRSRRPGRRRGPPRPADGPGRCA